MNDELSKQQDAWENEVILLEKMLDAKRDVIKDLTSRLNEFQEKEQEFIEKTSRLEADLEKAEAEKESMSDDNSAMENDIDNITEHLDTFVDHAEDVKTAFTNYWDACSTVSETSEKEEKTTLLRLKAKIEAFHNFADDVKNGRA